MSANRVFSKIGEKSFQELNGIFAFIIFDKLKIN